MAEAASVTIIQFSFFIVFALLGTVLSIRLRQPYVVGLLLFGMLAGPHVLSFVDDEGLIQTFSDLGAILLLFAVGIEFSVSRILKSGFRAVFITVFKMSILFILGYEAALYFGLDLNTSLIVGAMLSITSTAIMFKIVAQKGMSKNPTLPLLVSMLIVEDVVAVAALTFFSTLFSASGTTEDTVSSIFVSLGLLGAFYLLVRKPVASAILRMTATLSQEVMIFVSFSVCLVMSMVAAFFGLSPAIGAFLAGSIVASLPNSRRIEKEINPLLLMFASLFFLSLGMQIDPILILANLPFALILSALFMLACFFSILVLLYTTGATIKNSVFGASAMVVLGEFSLLIAAQSSAADSQVLVAVGSFGVVATALFSSLLLGHQKQLLELGRTRVPRGIKEAVSSLSAYMSGLIDDFSPSGAFWKISSVCWDCMKGKLKRMAVIIVVMLVLRFAAGLFIAQQPLLGQLRGAILLLGILPLLYFALGLFRDLQPVLDSLARTISRHKHDSEDENIILRDLFVAVLLIGLSIILPQISAALLLPSIFLWGDEVLFLLALVFLWDVYRHARELHRRRK